MDVAHLICLLPSRQRCINGELYLAIGLSEEPKRNILRAPAFDSAQVACSAVIAMDHVVF